MVDNMKNIEKFEKLVDDIEKNIPTPEYIKEKANINVISMKKYFPQAYRAKRNIITGTYIIFTMSKERYISSSKDILKQINIYMRDPEIENILVTYIYETDYLDTKRLESWLINKLILEPNINYHDNIIPKKIEDVISKKINIEDIIPKDINVIRCIDNITTEDIRYVSHTYGTYILQFVDRECYVGSSANLYNRLMRHRYRLHGFISSISICETQNVIDALILEGIFIKILKPKYNRIHGFGNPDIKQSINVPHKGKNRYTKRFFRSRYTEFISVSKDLSDLLNKKMIEMFNQGMFSLSIQTLAELAIKEGLDTVCDNISQIIEMEKYPVRTTIY